MCHEFEVVHHVEVLASWIFLELFELDVENVPVDLELWLVLVTLTLDLVLEFCKSVGFFVFVKSKGLSIFRSHQVKHLGVLASPFFNDVGTSRLRSPLLFLYRSFLHC